MPAKLVLAVIIPSRPFLLSLPPVSHDEFHYRDVDDDGERSWWLWCKLSQDAAPQYHCVASDQLFRCEKEKLFKLFLNFVNF